MDGEVYIYPHHGIPHRGVVDPPRTTTLRLRQPTVRTVLGSRIPRLPISFTRRFSLSYQLPTCTPTLFPYPHHVPPRRLPFIFLSFSIFFRSAPRMNVIFLHRSPINGVSPASELSDESGRIRTNLQASVLEAVRAGNRDRQADPSAGVIGFIES